MADTCVPTSHCGTHSPGWLKGAHPVKEGEIVQRKVCFHFGSRCCKWNAKIKVKKCKGFFVYELQRTPGCNLRYCGNSGQGKQKLVIYLSIFQILHYVGGYQGAQLNVAMIAAATPKVIVQEFETSWSDNYYNSPTTTYDYYYYYYCSQSQKVIDRE